MRRNILTRLIDLFMKTWLWCIYYISRDEGKVFYYFIYKNIQCSRKPKRKKNEKGIYIYLFLNHSNFPLFKVY